MKASLDNSKKSFLNDSLYYNDIRLHKDLNNISQHSTPFEDVD